MRTRAAVRGQHGMPVPDSALAAHTREAAGGQYTLPLLQQETDYRPLCIGQVLQQRRCTFCRAGEAVSRGVIH